MLGQLDQSNPAQGAGAPPSPGAEQDEDLKKKFQSKSGKDDDDSPEAMSRKAQVKRWLKRIKDAKRKHQPDFDRMVENMDFVAGLQWKEQKTIKTDKYVVNLTLRTINQRVATLYARDPKASWTPRKRLNYQLWSGDMEEIQSAIQQSLISMQTGMGIAPETVALLNDFQAGRAHEALVKKICKTGEILYEYQQSNQEPKFKTQMKHLVRRVSVCGVGYIKPIFCRDYENELTQSETRLNLVDRAKMASRILERFQEGKVQDTEADMQKLRELVQSFDVGPMDPEATQVKEHVVFDFPQATSIIPDPNCRILRGFVGARWIVEEFKFPVEFVNMFFEKDIQPGQDLKEYGPDGQPIEQTTNVLNSDGNDPDKTKMCLWQVYDLDTRGTFIVADGYKDYIMEPESVSPMTRGFWQIVPVVFNDVEVTDGCKAGVFPPSDVDLIRHPQMEYNRIKNSIRRHRIANRPRGMYAEGTLGEEDLDAIQYSDDQEMVPLKGVAPGTDISKILVPLALTPISPELYDTNGVQEDVLLATGNQESNIGPAQPNVTATVGNIAEQSRISVSASDVDGLDDSLSDVAQITGEFMMKEFGDDTAKRIAGVGAILPQENREDFLNEIDICIQAASSGRPNKAIDVNNWERVVPLIIQASSMPPQNQPTMQAIIRETLKRIDDNLEPADFFPLPVPVMPPPPSQDGQQPPDQGPGANPSPRPGQRANAPGRGQRNNSSAKYQQQPKPRPQPQVHEMSGG